MSRGFSQIELCAAIFEFLGKRRFPDLNARQMNAVIHAADDIIAELDKPTVLATPGMGLRAWINSDDTGLSSRYLAQELARVAGLPAELRPQSLNYPRDPADLGRCVRLLEAVSDLRQHLPVMAQPQHGPVWNALAAAWEELEALYREEYPTGSAPKLYARLREISTGAEKQS